MRWWWPLGLVFGILILFYFVSALAWLFGLRTGYGVGPHYGFFWPVFPLGFLLFLFLLFFAFRLSSGWGYRGGWRHHDHGDRAQEILEERFARGEISREQLFQMKRDLDGTR